MKDFSRGVSYYTFGRVDTGFPEDDLCCQWCPLMDVEARTDRLICRMTHEYLVNPKFSVGMKCPIQFSAITADEDAGTEKSENKNEGVTMTWEYPFF